MSKRIRVAGLPVGGPSLLMVFVLLCINIFAVVSYMSAVRDYKLSEKTAESISQYYSADIKAKEMLETIANELEKDPNGIKKMIGVNNLRVSDEIDKINIKYDIQIKKEMILKVEVQFLKTTFQHNIVAWKVVNTNIIDEDVFLLDLPEL